MIPTPIRHGVILFAHGSRDPQWRAPVEAVATRTQELAPDALVRCAYLELMEPDLEHCVEAMVAQGVQTITIVPMFLGVGRHAREDLPRLLAQLQARYPHTRFALRPSIGEDSRVVEMLARLILTDA